MGLNMTKPVFGVYKKVILELVYSATRMDRSVPLLFTHKDRFSLLKVHILVIRSELVHVFGFL